MSKTFILMRHGDALDSGLTGQGIEQTRNIARQMMEMGYRIDVILHSPLPRAVETAGIIAEEYKAAGKEVAIVRAHQHLAINRKHIPTVISDFYEEEEVALIISHDDDIKDAMLKLTGEECKLSYSNAVVLNSESEDWESVVMHPGSNKRICVLVPTP